MTDPLFTAAILPVTPFQQNCTLIWCKDSLQGALIDPGGDVERIKTAVAAKSVTIEKILLTHGHLDHAGGAAALARHYGVPIEGPQEDEAFLLANIAEQSRQFGFSGENCRPDRWLVDGDTVTVGGAMLAVRHCPGHTPGHVVYFHDGARLAFVGDVLFKGSIGRTDFPGGNHAQLIASITERLWPLGDDVRFIPGHGEMSSFGQERKTNPFVGDLALSRG